MASAKSASVKRAPVKKAPAKEAPAKKAPGKNAPPKKAPASRAAAPKKTGAAAAKRSANAGVWQYIKKNPLKDSAKRPTINADGKK